MNGRIHFTVLLLLMHLYTWAQTGGDDHLSVSSDSGNASREYTLTLKATPTSGGSFNFSTTSVSVGNKVSLRAYPNTDFSFVAWMCNADTISKSVSCDYVMPDHDVEIMGVFVYNPNNPADPNVPSQKYRLTLHAIPQDGGSFNTSIASVSVGENVNLRAYPYADYTFTGWVIGNDTISKAASYNYVMPASNVDIYGVFTYDPSNPTDPQEEALKYQLSISCTPINSGSFNFYNERISVGTKSSLWAYPSTDFVFSHWSEGDSVLSSNQRYDFTMPSRNVSLVGHFIYNPSNPGNPNSNYWNKELGEVIVDDFTPGSLGSALSAVIGDSNRDDVAMITVAGKMADNDIGLVNEYNNCTLLDLSRVTGVTEIPSYTFDYTSLESIYLPATVETIGYKAFYECKNLTALTVYAMIPPALEEMVFAGVQEGMIVYVPVAAIAQYRDADGWKDFTILPIQEDIRSISISIPAGANVSDYARMWLELTNTKSGQKMHYVMTDRQTYTFANIIRNTSWSAVLRNQRGAVFGKIEAIDVKEEDVAVSFASLAKPQHVTLSVVTPDGTDVTSKTKITWFDADGNYLEQATGLTGLLAGDEVSYKITLPQEMAMSYVAPQQAGHVVNDGNNNIQLRLEGIKQVTLSGNVRDLSTNVALNGAMVTASQTFGDKYSKTVSTRTDAEGNYALVVSNVPTSLAVSASDYISQTLDCDSLMTGADSVTVPAVLLKGISGAVISLGLSYTGCPAIEGSEDALQEWRVDYNNITYNIFNKTKQRAITRFSVQYPQIVLLEDVEEGDVIEITAVSRANAFMPVKSTATIDSEQRANVTFNIVEPGKINASFARSGNETVVGSLYDSKGKLLKSYTYSNASLVINGLLDGTYTLVSMGGSKLFNSIYDLNQLPQTGLVIGTDYTQTSVEVSSGKVCSIDIDEVPTLDESKLYYTGDNTSFTVSKSGIIVGNYLTLTSRLDFKPAYASNVSKVNLIVDLPESCEFVENSVLVGNDIGSYTFQDNRITIPLDSYTDRVRFCVIPTLGGDYAPSALVRFELDGETITQPIGSVNYSAKNLSVSVPSTVAKSTVPVSGSAIGASEIKIYDGDVLIGRTTSLANGRWSTTCELNEPCNLSTHNIYAKVTTKNGLELVSDPVKCQYDEYSVQVSKVTMYHENPEMHKTYTVTFDFLNPNSVPQKYTYYIYNKKFTFTIDFTTSNPDAVANVVLWVKTGKGNLVPLEAFFDEAKECWVASGEFGDLYDGDIPVNVSVDFDALLHGPVSRQLLTDAEFDYKGYSNKQNDIDNEFSNLEDKFTSGSLTDEEFETLFDQLTSTYDDNKEDIDYSDLNAQELLALSGKLLQQSETIRDSLLSGLQDLLSMKEFNSFDLSSMGIDGALEISPTEGITSESLLEKGYEAISVDDNSYLYRLVTDSSYIIVDIEKGKRYSLVYQTETANYVNSLKKSGNIQLLINKVNEYQSRVDELFSLLGKINDILNLVPEFFEANINKITLAIEENKAAYKALQYYEGMLPTASENLEISEQITKLKAENIKLGKERSRLITNYEGVMKAVSKITGILSAFFDLYTTGSNAYKYINLWYEVPFCSCDTSKTESLQNDILNAGLRCAGKDLANLAGDMVSIYLIWTSAALAPETAGTSLCLFVAGVGVSLFKGIINEWSDNEFKKERALFQTRISNLARDKSCYNCPNPAPKPQNPPKPPKPRNPIPSGNSDCDPSIDPSGFVYESVFSNRLEGVTATAYYKEIIEDMYGDLHENIVKWNAEEYAQENPLFTDDNGYYRWDVPQGLWQVKFEKDGYETTYSEWLPVPPPQLEVNIAMKQNVQPNVKNVRAYEDAVDVEFDKYMMPEFLNVENIIVMSGNRQVEGTIELLDEEVKYEGESETFASKLRFNSKEPFEGTEVTLMVNNRVKSYAGIRMQDNYSQSFTIEQEIREIVCDSATVLGYGRSGNIPVTVLPATASAGKTLSVRSSSSVILGTDITSIKLDEKGKAAIPVRGELPGTAALTFTVDGCDLSATTIVNIKQIDVEAPEANIASGTTVVKGTEITLTCATEGATIYYTLDGSCPCDEASRLVYEKPIVVNDDVTIRAMAVAPDLTESEVVEFTYIVTTAGVVDDQTLDTNFKIYPIPVRDRLNVTAGGKMIKSVTLISTDGSTMVNASRPMTLVTLDVHSLTPGIYVVTVVTEDKIYSRKVVKVE